MDIAACLVTPITWQHGDLLCHHFAVPVTLLRTLHTCRGLPLQAEGQSPLIGAHHPDARMRSADISINAPGAPLPPQRLFHNHNASASGNRTMEELLTALRKVALPFHPTLQAVE